MIRPLVAAPLALLFASLFGPPQQPVFRGGVDVVAVDVHAIDNKGRPVEDLRAGDFTVAIDGQPRAIASAQYVPVASAVTSQPVVTKTAPLRPLFSSNMSVGPVSGRLILLVVDQESMRPEGGHFAMKAAQAFVDRLGPNDRIGLAVIPNSAISLDPTTDHDAVKRALERVVGHATSNQSPSLQYNIGLSEAFAVPARDAKTWDLVVRRECYKRDPSCPTEVENVAGEMAREAHRRTLDSLRAQRALMAALGEIRGPKHLVLVSEQLAVTPYQSERSDIEAEMRDVAKAAAASQVSTYVLQLPMPLFDASTVGIPQTASADAAVRADGLQEVAAITGGSFFMVSGSSEGAFERLALETSGYYLLGVRTEAGDRDGKSHRIDVRVARRGITVRARRQFSYGTEMPGSDASLDPTRVVHQMLGQGFPAAELPVAVTTYTVRDEKESHVRVLISAEIDRGMKAPSELTVGFVLLNGQGAVTGSSVEQATLAPVPGIADAPLSYVAASIVPPGHYHLRVAAVDGAGRRGLVVHDVNARLTMGDPVNTSDLLIFDPHRAAGGKQRPSVSAVMNDSVNVYLEVYPQTPPLTELLEARLEVASGVDTPALVTRPMEVGETPSPGRLLASGAAPLDGLAPGVYMARALVFSDGRAVARVVRPFRIER